MATVLLAWELGAGTGHCVNLRPIAEGLLARGHRVWFAARELAAANAVFGELAVSHVQAPHLVGSPSEVIQRPETFAQILHNVGFGDDGWLSSLVIGWRNLFQLVQPDAIVCEHAPSALLASRWMGMRRFVIGTGFFSPPDVSPLPNIRPGCGSEASAAALRCEHAILDRVNKMLASGGLHPLERVASLYREVDANFLVLFREFDHYPQRTNAQYHGCWNPPGGESPNWADNGIKIFAYLQSPKDLKSLDRLLAILNRINASTVIYVPRISEALIAEHGSSRLRFHRRPLNIAEVWQQCDIGIHNGNAGTAAALSLYGIPQLAIPLYLEQAVFAQRLVESGIGLALRGDQVEFVPRALQELVANRRFKASALRFAETYSQPNSNFGPCRIIEQIATRLNDS